MKNSYNLTLRNRPFQAIIQGEKTVEIRANKQDGSINYNQLLHGDVLVFRNEETNQIINCIVKRKSHYETVHELLVKEGTLTTLSSTNSIRKGIKSIEAIGNYREIILIHGVFAIEIELKTTTNTQYKKLGGKW